MRTMKILSAQEIEKVFSNLEMLLPFNRILLGRLEERVDDNLYVDGIGDALLRVVRCDKVRSNINFLG
jgi:hypothetical protein